MEIPENLLCLFTARVDEYDDRYIVEIPESEFDLGGMEQQETYRVAILPTPDMIQEESVLETESIDRTHDFEDQQTNVVPEPPVQEGEIREVEIEDIGEQGDGIARVERGYVIIVPDTNVNESPTIKITNVRENVAFGELVDEAEQIDSSENENY